MRFKGLMHSLEGIIAALLLLSYSAAIIQYPHSSTNWAEVKEEQISREYLSAFNDAGLSRLIVENNPSAFLKVTRHFLGVRYSYGLYTKGLIQQNVLIGVLANESVMVNTVFDAACSSSGVSSEFDCYEGTFRGHDFVLIDNDTNGFEDYDSIYFDSDKNLTYDAYEGPRTVSSIVNASGEMWIFTSVDNTTKGVEFIFGEDVVRYRDKFRGMSINNREINLSVRGRTNESDIMDLDVLIIPKYMDLVRVKSRLSLFLDEGKSIIEVANITKDNLDEVQEEIFGLRYLDGVDVVLSANRDISVAAKGAMEQTNEIGKYFNFTDIRIGTKSWVRYNNLTWTVPYLEYDCYLSDMDYYLGHVNCTDIFAADPCTTYTVSGLLGYVNLSLIPQEYCIIGGKDASRVYHYGSMDIRKEEYFVLVLNTSFGDYDRVVIDKNQNENLTDDDLLAVGDTFSIGSTDFMLKKIDVDGRYIDVRPVSGHVFVDMYPDKLYTVHNDSEYVVLESLDVYNITAYDLGYELPPISTVAGSGGCPLGGMFPGFDYKSGSIVLNAIYPFTVTNISKGFNVLNIDLDGNGRCDGLDEGPFYTGDLLRVGPEYYRVDIEQNGSLVNWTLADRWRVPAAIVNHKNGLRKTAWISGNITSDDEWHILRSLVLWSSNQKSVMLKSTSGLGSVLVKTTFIEDSDMFQPYKVYFRSGG